MVKCETELNVVVCWKCNEESGLDGEMCSVVSREWDQSCVGWVIRFGTTERSVKCYRYKHSIMGNVSHRRVSSKFLVIEIKLFDI